MQSIIRILKWIWSRVFKNKLTSLMGTVLIVFGIVYVTSDATAATMMITSGVGLLMMRDKDVGIK